ncbi:MAG TPA: hypothetical protein VJ717_20315, partial [Gemmatimonadaceae bacterium]|nr:hypothetical protein [Gemmatimonadaceae bacterium]
ITLQPVEDIPAMDLAVPGDPSSAAFFVALATVADEGEIVLRGVSLNPTRTGFIDVLRRMGAQIEAQASKVVGGEPTGDLVARSSGHLAGTTISADEVPSLIDEIPLLACVASRAAGETLIDGAGDLRAKESDRIAAIVANLRAIGGDADELPNGLRVRGTPGARFRGPVRTFGDHRIAMAFAILNAASGGEIEIDDPDCVAISYPDFWRDLARLTA